MDMENKRILETVEIAESFGFGTDAVTAAKSIAKDGYPIKIAGRLVAKSPIRRPLQRLAAKTYE